MISIHKTLMSVNEEFLVAEAPAGPLLNALRQKDVLTSLDWEQIRCLEAQGPRAVKRFVVNVLPKRGPLAFPAFLEALQEARAQHLVDLLLEEERVLSAACKPIELPEKEPPKPLPDPNEYARKLQANKHLIEEAVDPNHVTPTLAQNGVLSALEQGLLERVKGQHAPTWTVLWGVLMQRGQRAYSAFMAALLQHGYSALFHTIEETNVGKSSTALVRTESAQTPLIISKTTRSDDAKEKSEHDNHVLSSTDQPELRGNDDQRTSSSKAERRGSKSSQKSEKAKSKRTSSRSSLRKDSVKSKENEDGDVRPLSEKNSRPVSGDNIRSLSRENTGKSRHTPEGKRPNERSESAQGRKVSVDDNSKENGADKEQASEDAKRADSQTDHRGEKEGTTDNTSSNEP